MSVENNVCMEGKKIIRRHFRINTVACIYQEKIYIQRHLSFLNYRVLYMYHTQRLLCCVHRVCMLYIPVLYIAAVCTVYSIYSTFAPF